MGRTLKDRLSAALAFAACVAALLCWPGVAAAAASDWSQYLHGPQHSSMSPTAAITTANAAGLSQLWHWTPAAVSGKPAPKLDASPTVVGTNVYIGSNTGVLYALKAATGTVALTRALDVEAKLTCRARGIAATAAVAV